jgi:hypothetical protein
LEEHFHFRERPFSAGRTTYPGLSEYQPIFSFFSVDHLQPTRDGCPLLSWGGEGSKGVFPVNGEFSEFLIPPRQSSFQRSRLGRAKSDQLISAHVSSLNSIQFPFAPARIDSNACLSL